MRRRGFTLEELVIVIGVSTLLVGTIVALLVSLNEHSQFRAADTLVRDEIQNIELKTKDFFAFYDSAEYPAPEVDAEGSVLRFGSDADRISAESVLSTEQCIMAFTRTKDGEATTETITTSAVTSALFEKGEGENIVKVTLKYRDSKNVDRTYSFMLIKQSMNKVTDISVEP